MKIFEPHIHMYSRNTRDYAEMATAGIRSLLEPGGFWLGRARQHPETCLEYFDHLLEFEHTRAAKAGIKYHCTFALNPKEAHTPAIREAVMAALPKYLEHPLCCALGEVGYDVIDKVEEEAYATARRIAGGAPLVNRWHKKFVDRVLAGHRTAMPLNEAELAEGYACFDTADFNTGYRAFLAKQKPEFEGR